MVRRNFLSVVVCVIASWFAVAIAGSAWAWESPVEGGPGGGPFRIQCPNNGFIIGFEGHTGAYIDHLRIICAVIDPRAMQLQRTGALNINVGTSGGGGPAFADCPNGWAVSKIAFENTWRDYKQDGFVHHINFFCTPPRGSESIWRTYGPPGPAPAPSTAFFSRGKFLATSSEHDCPAGQLATGLQGRSGLYVDALGLICTPIPAAVISPTQQNQSVIKQNTPGAPNNRSALLGPSTGAPPPPAAPPPPLPGMQGQRPVDDQGRVAVRNTGFGGNWNTRTDKGWSYQMSLQQNGNNVNGSYVAQNGANGQISGRIRNNVLEFTWTQDGGFKGTGQFALAPDGNSFSGTYRAHPHPSLTDPRYLQGSWSGSRQ